MPLSDGTPRRRPLGIVDINIGRDLPPALAADRARELGYDHIDLCRGWREPVSLPVGDVVSRVPRRGYSVPAPADGEGVWDRAIRTYRRIGELRMEPWEGSICNTIEKTRAMLDAVPSLRLMVDTGHVATWGEDPVELLPWADHVQLRQARRDEPQTLEGDVDFARVLARLDEIGYRGRLSIEYFDLPEMGWPLDEPLAYAVELTKQLDELLR